MVLPLHLREDQRLSSINAVPLRYTRKGMPSFKLQHLCRYSSQVPSRATSLMVRVDHQGGPAFHLPDRAFSGYSVAINPGRCGESSDGQRRGIHVTSPNSMVRMTRSTVFLVPTVGGYGKVLTEARNRISRCLRVGEANDTQVR